MPVCWDVFFYLGCLIKPPWERKHLVLQDLKCQGKGIPRDLIYSEEKGRGQSKGLWDWVTRRGQ